MTKQQLDKIKAAIPAKAPKDLSEYLEVFFAKVPEDELSHMSPEDAVKTVRTHYDMSKKRNDAMPEILFSRPAGANDETNCTVIDIVQEDMAFIVDSVVAEIVRHKQTIDYLIHPMLKIQKTKAGIKTSPNSKDHEGEAESHMHIQLHGLLTDIQIEELEMGLRNVLTDVDYATKDWIIMREKLREAQKALVHAPGEYDDIVIEEYQAFLEYMYDNNFTLLGYREYKFVNKDGKLSSQTAKGKSLGLLRDEIKPVYINEAREGLTQTQQKMRKEQEPVTISKANKRSTVHRRVPLDVIAVKTFDKKGKVTGEMMFIGLFTSVTYSRSIGDIPYLRMKANFVLNKAQFTPGSHDSKALKHILEKYPRDELFQIDNDSLYKHVISILRLQERPRIALYTRPDPFGRYISCLVYVPRERYETRLRLRFMNILEEELGGRCVNFKVTQDDSPLSRVIFFVDINHLPNVPKYDETVIENRLVEAGRVWADRLKNALDQIQESEESTALIIQKFGQAFPVNYHEKYTPAESIEDIRKIQQVIEDKQIKLNLYKPEDCESDKLRLKCYSPASPIPLSDILPILENLGLKVLAELPFEIQPAKEREAVWIHDFLLDIADKNLTIEVEDVKAVFEEALSKIIDRQMENDGLNKLVLGARMGWRQIVILRTYARYMRQMGLPFSRAYIEKALTSYPEIGGAIIRLFDTLHNPRNKKSAKEQAAGLMVEIDHLMETVSALDFDRILRKMTKLVNATLRTNFYQTDENGNPKPYLSVKLDSRKLESLPDPKPYREIFVYSPRVEGIHLRGDVIARGGIRWSDRHEDFRTEVLGLMKAQMVKNAVIVPMGAKGGFVVKHPPLQSGPQAIREEGIECYKIFIRGLLDITDNRQGEKIIPPKDVVRRDGDDPYLVVAADKGTATFSDIANGLSQEYGFWLDDAFASGGSAGYDHKVMGITARGAWESVKRHFRELNHDTQTQEFDVIGVGDMGGDVFGNGTLLSEHIRLIGAFNHLHIFCDPNPDVAASFNERERLFEAVKGWDAYNTKLLSEGGRIFNRQDKNLELTPEIQKAFDIQAERVTPNELISAMLKARTDLLWFGGIGTYIKSSEEDHGDVGDKSNDPLRINARDLKSKVLGEGANLAITQRGRIEAAKNGVKLNADFIDNSAGVDSSDNEVNIKILMTDIIRKPKHNMDTKKRNKLLEKMTDEVAENVLQHNYQQVQGISLIELNAADELPAHAELMHKLEKTIGLDRQIECLPDEEEIAERKRNGKGLTRPEISVLVSYAKIDLTQDLLKTDIPDSKALEEWVMHYFPKALRENYKKEILDHQLKREIIATMLANGIINRMGPSFVLDRIGKCGVTSAEVAKAYTIVRETFDLKALWDKIEALDNKVPAMVQLKAKDEISLMTERAITWLLTRTGRDLNIEKDIAEFQEGVRALRKHLGSVVTDAHKEMIEMATARGESDGLPRSLAQEIAMMPMLSSAFDIIRIATKQKADIALTARAYFELGDHFHLDWMRQQARYLPADDIWASEALDGLVDQLYSCQAGITVRIMKDMNGSLQKSANGKTSILKNWIKDHGEQVQQIEPLFRDLRGASHLDLPMLVIAEQRLRNLYGG